MNLENKLNYHLWAENLLLAKFKDISTEKLENPIQCSLKSIRDISHHKTLSVSYFTSIIKGDSSYGEEKIDSMNTLELCQELLNLLKELPNLEKKNNLEKYELTRKGKTVNFTFYEIIFNFLNHLTYHRGHLTHILRLIGHKVDMSDYLPYRVNIIN